MFTDTSLSNSHEHGLMHNSMVSECTPEEREKNQTEISFILSFSSFAN